MQVHNSLTGKKEPLIVGRSDAVSWCVRPEGRGGEGRDRAGPEGAPRPVSPESLTCGPEGVSEGC